MYITPKVYGQNQNIRIKYLELSILNHINEPAYTADLKSLATDLYEFRARVSAMEALKKLGICDEGTIYQMLNASLSSNGRLAGPAKTILKYFQEQSNYKILIERGIKQGGYSDADIKVFTEAGLYKK